MGMRKIRLSTLKSLYFQEAWSLYVAAFPEDERRDLDYQILTMQQPAYHFEVYVDGEVFVGFMGWWDFDDVRYLEHFATSEKLRGGGLGRKILEDFTTQSDKPMLLEVELPEDELTRRRVGFYERLGFVLNKHAYVQPPYRVGGNPVDLLIMTYPCAILEDELRDFVEKCHPVIHTL